MENEIRIVIEETPQPQSAPLFIPNEEDTNKDQKTLKVRLDKWLWAARFFKTRALAMAAVEQGNVLYNSKKCVPNREIEIGAVLNISIGKQSKQVKIIGLSTRRRGNSEASALYEEIFNSIKSDVYTDSQDRGYKNRKIVRYLRRPQKDTELFSKDIE